jgi:rifampicin phosphotransferase
VPSNQQSSEDRWITDWPASPRWPHYTRANAGEVLPTPASPLGQQFSWDNAMVPGWRDGYNRRGLYDMAEWDTKLPEVIGFFGGYFYINLSNVRMQGVRNPMVTVEQLDLAFFGDHPDVPKYVEHPDDQKPEYTERIMADLGWVMSTSSWPEIDEDRVTTTALRTNRPDLSALTDAELVARARSTQPMLQKLFEVHAISSGSAGIAPGILFAVGQAIGDPTSPMKLLAGMGDVDSAEPGFALWELSRIVRASSGLTAAFDAGVDGLIGRIEALAPSTDSKEAAAASAFLTQGNDFLTKFGSRGPNEWEMTSDTWETNPSIALAALDRIRLQPDSESPTIRQAARTAERETVTAEVRAKVSALGNDELTGSLEAALVAGNFLAFRERTKTNLIRVVHEGRMVFRELGHRHAATGALHDPAHIFMLLDAEVEPFIGNPTAYTHVLAKRYVEWKQLFELEPPFFIKDGVVPPLSTWPKRGAAVVTKVTVGEVLHGVAGCPGIVRGIARVITDPSDPGALGAGEILVAPLTDPAWTPLFVAAGGVVVNVGGQISHAIIVSRELGLPCVVSVTDATARIPDGATIEVDGNTGKVTILSLP